MKVIVFIALILTLINGYAKATPFDNGRFTAGALLPAAGSSVSICEWSGSATGMAPWRPVFLNAGGDSCVEWVRSPATITGFSGVYPGTANFVIDLSHDQIDQVFTTVTGRTYNFSFKYANSIGVADCQIFYAVRDLNGHSIADYWNGTILLGQFLNITSAPTNVWQTVNQTFTATSNTTFVGFDSGSLGVSSCDRVLMTDVFITYPPAQTMTVSRAVYDPLAQNLKAIPTHEVMVTGDYSNTGGSPDRDVFNVTLSVNNNLRFRVGSVTFTDGAGANATGLTCCSGSEVSYSSTGTSGPWTYTPSGTYDPAVKAIKIVPSGIMNEGTGAVPVTFKVTYRAQIL